MILFEGSTDNMLSIRFFASAVTFNLKETNIDKRLLDPDNFMVKLKHIIVYERSNSLPHPIQENHIDIAQT